MTINDDWWQLMTIDDNWWQLMMIEYDQWWLMTIDNDWWQLPIGLWSIIYYKSMPFYVEAEPLYDWTIIQNPL